MALAPQLTGNSTAGFVQGKCYVQAQLQQATAATGSAAYVVPYWVTGGTVVGVYASELVTASSDRTDTITVAKRAQNAASSADTALLTTSGVISSNNVSGTITRAIGSTGITAFTTSVNPVLTTTAASLAVVGGDTILISNTAAGSNGSAGTVLSVVVVIEVYVGDTANRFSY